ncbi:hypothetical protein [Duncaniella dubosii]|uniref:hypothetical protein n=1 Tax=Duncaniella dubosii TaxID=2518971 RepID=UPI0023F1007B|nr:hypothetical protein [Duncaniella dubosii]MCX4284361.1 hypothetical protein [Duncaniella dubosii]
MKIQNVKKHILNVLEPFASANNFKILKGRFALSRKVGNRTDEIFFTYCSWGFEVNIFPYVSVDYGEITTICNDCGFNLNHSAFINLLLLQRIKQRGFNEDLRWKMQVTKTDRFILSDDETDDYNQLDIGLSPLLPISLNFLSQYNSINSIDRLFNNPPIEQYNPYCSGLDTHCMIGLISAKLSNNADYENIKQMYQRIVEKEDFTDNMKSSFTRLTTYLDNYETDG